MIIRERKQTTEPVIVPAQCFEGISRFRPWKRKPGGGEWTPLVKEMELRVQGTGAARLCKTGTGREKAAQRESSKDL